MTMVFAFKPFFWLLMMLSSYLFHCLFVLLLFFYTWTDMMYDWGLFVLYLFSPLPSLLIQFSCRAHVRVQCFMKEHLWERLVEGFLFFHRVARWDDIYGTKNCVLKAMSAILFLFVFKYCFILLKGHLYCWQCSVKFTRALLLCGILGLLSSAFLRTALFPITKWIQSLLCII